MTQLKVLICGGGIAGNVSRARSANSKCRIKSANRTLPQALAFWLSRLDHDVTVIERFPDLRTTGLQLDLRGHGVEVMRRMGLEQAFRAKSPPEQGTKIVDKSGKVWAYFPANKTGKGLQSFTTDFEIMRGDLCRLIYDATKDRTKFVFGTSVESFEERDSFLDVLFSDGKRDRFDLLVGADGQWSRTRKMMLGTSTADAIRFVSTHIGYFTVPREIQEGEEYNGTVFFASGKRFVFTRRHSPHSIQVYLGFGDHSNRLEDVPRGNVAEEKEAMIEVFQGAGWQTDALLKLLESSDDFYLERLGVVKLDAWSRGRVALVGDAAYCPTALTGMGTTCGIVGAYILAGEIAKHCGRSGTKDGLSSALKAYDEKFRPFMNQVQHGIAEGSSVWQFIPTSSFGISILNFFMWVIALLRLNVIGMWILREDVRNWALPDYKEMVQGKH